MNQRSILTIATTVVLLGVMKPTHAEEVLKYRQILHTTAALSQDVGDADGHAVTVFRFSGLASLSDGTVGTATGVGTNDYIKGAGSNAAYFSLTLKDGSVLWFKSVGTAKMDGTTALIEGTATVLGGKGRFEGAKGEGTVTGARLVPLAAGADLYLDVALNVKK
ncbi:MAG TPA: hypothetical protein VKW08_11155 [Xanthobacteraceae bacterium]|nr:hypothetical protein [Xanthobacteraceae bacterium]